MKKLKIYCLALLSVFFISCGGGDALEDFANTLGDTIEDSACKSGIKSSCQFGIFNIENNSTARMDGEITTKTLYNFDKLYKKYPNIKTINIKQCDGSSDDEINLKLSKKIHALGIKTHLLDNGTIASGGTDFFLAGVKRTIGKNTKIGVHSWSDGIGNQAKDFPKGHKYHLPYIEYYKSIGFTQKEAEDFYYFTIYSASSDDIYWMSQEEIKKYKITTEPLNQK